jgi:hypothetical protein
MHAKAAILPSLKAEDSLLFHKNNRALTAYTFNDAGARELHVYFGDNEINFDEPHLFAFGEALAQQSTFTASDAMYWGPGYSWEQVRDLLEELLRQGVLRLALTRQFDLKTGALIDGARAPLLPPAPSTQARTWFDSEAITRELTGRPLELGHLEQFVPIFRVAHMSMDAEGRHVGEANVFPKPLRTEVPTNWRSCIYSGSRFQADAPMNVSALKSMRADWAQMMAVLLKVRAYYLQRFPQARAGWTVGHLERLSVLVLTLPSYLLMRTEKTVKNGDLHPALSCLFRVTDGLRLTMHQMLFIPVAESTLSPDTPMSSQEVFAYAERNYAFHSEFGVCAGPKNMIEEFLSVIIDGQEPKFAYTEAFAPQVQEALDQLDQVFEYAMGGLQVYAAIFSSWPVMTRTYEELFAITQAWSQHGSQAVRSYCDRLAEQIEQMRTRTFLATEQWRGHRESSYGDMYQQCTQVLRSNVQGFEPLAQQLLPKAPAQHYELFQQLVEALDEQFGCTSVQDALQLDRFASCLLNYFYITQSVLRVASDSQETINTVLGRAPAKRDFSAADIDVHNLLQLKQDRTLPFLLNEIESLLNIHIHIDKNDIEITQNKAIARICPASRQPNSAGIPLAV